MSSNFNGVFKAYQLHERAQSDQRGTSLLKAIQGAIKALSLVSNWLRDGGWSVMLWRFPILVIPKGYDSSKLMRLPAC
jgi:hypothetical protein